jgi:hypothetical protein
MSRSLFFAWTTDKLSLDLWDGTPWATASAVTYPSQKPQIRYNSICGPAILCDC